MIFKGFITFASEFDKIGPPFFDFIWFDCIVDKSMIKWSQYSRLEHAGAYWMILE